MMIPLRRHPAVFRCVAAVLTCAMLALILPPSAQAQQAGAASAARTQAGGEPTAVSQTRGEPTAASQAGVGRTESQAPGSQPQESRGPSHGEAARPLPSREPWAHGTGHLPSVQQNPPIDLPPAQLWPWLAVIVGAIAGVALLIALVARQATQATLRDRGIGEALAADPPEVTFGIQPRDAPATRRVAIISRSERDILVTAVAVSGRCFEIVPAPALPQTLTPGGRLEVDVQFQSSSPGGCSGKLSVKSNVGGGNLTVRLHARVQ